MKYISIESCIQDATDLFCLQDSWTDQIDLLDKPGKDVHLLKQQADGLDVYISCEYDDDGRYSLHGGVLYFRYHDDEPTELDPIDQDFLANYRNLMGITEHLLNAQEIRCKAKGNYITLEDGSVSQGGAIYNDGLTFMYFSKKFDDRKKFDDFLKTETVLLHKTLSAIYGFIQYMNLTGMMIDDKCMMPAYGSMQDTTAGRRRESSRLSEIDKFLRAGEKRLRLH